MNRNISAQHTREPLQHEHASVHLYTYQLERGNISKLPSSVAQESTIFSTSGSQSVRKKERERIDLIGVCYQLLLHRWDVFRTSIDESGVVLAE